jgi:PTH1 family peptidyl-tRNA hydrolase
MTSKKTILVGLGNRTHPGTRHSVGQVLVARLASMFNLQWERDRNSLAHLAVLSSHSSCASSVITSFLFPTEPLLTSLSGSALSSSSSVLSPSIDLKEQTNRSAEVETERRGSKRSLTKSRETDLNQANESKADKGKEIAFEGTEEAPEAQPNSAKNIKKVKHKKLPPKPLPRRLKGEIIFVEPTTPMNLNGKTVSCIKRKFSVAPENIIVVHDDCETKLGKAIMRLGGGARGHNGIRSVMECITTSEFHRVRIGIGKPAEIGLNMDLASFVLQPFTQEEDSLLERAMNDAIRQILLAVTEEIQPPMTLH